MKENGILTRGGSALRWVAALAICALFLLPILWVLSISLKPPDEWLAYPPRLVPAQTTLNNYVLLFRKGNPVGGISEMVSSAEPVTPAFLNSLLIVPIATLASLIIGFLASYGITRFQAGGASLPLFVLTTRMFPPVAFAVPLLVYFRALGLIDTQLALILMYTGFTIAFSLWMMRGFIEGVPRHVEEAAILDGASPWRVLFTITLPLIAPAVAAGWMLAFTLSLDDLVVASFTTGPGATTLPIRIYSEVRLGVKPEINAVCTIMIAVVAGALVVASLLAKFGAGSRARRAQTGGA